MDRRGRGRSGFGTEPYSIEREADDIAAVLAATGAPTVVAHSYGGLWQTHLAHILAPDALAAAVDDCHA